MVRMLLATLIAALLAGTAAADPEGLVTKPGRYPPAAAAERLEKVLKGAGMTVFSVIDHAAAAEKSGLRMPAARLVVFGNPEGGTPLMLNAPTIAIDLLLKVLLWEVAQGRSWMSYNSASYVATRHRLSGMEKIVQGLDGALAKLTASIVE